VKRQLDPSTGQQITPMTPLPTGIVGAGRSRNGLGPFLASVLERAGCRVTAVAGRSPARTEANAAALGERLGHDVRPCRDLDELCASGIAALVIASPPEHHLAALEAAAAARLPVLCEKPLVHEDHFASGAEVVSRFVGSSVLLTENGHWPFVLPVLRELYGDVSFASVRQLSLGLGSVTSGRALVQNALPHLLSLAQAVGHVDADTMADGVSLDRPTLVAPNVVRARLCGPRIDLRMALHLDPCPNPPRPAWLEIDGARLNRRVGPGYTFSFSGNGREMAVADPMQQLVFRFAELLRRPTPSSIAAEGETVRQRLRLCHDILSRLR
jgi:hypothetical protein